MKQAIALAVLAAAGCSSKDDCAIASQKMMDYGARKTGKQVPAGVLDEAIRRCREQIGASKRNADDVKCIVAAQDDDALQACMVDSAGGDEPAPAPAAPRAEAERELMRLGQLMKVEYATHDAFPTASLPLTPAVACCAQPQKRCTDAAPWQAPGWTALDFRIDEPSDYQFAVESTATSFKATAVGDPGCTGKPETWVLEGTVDKAAGYPRVNLQRPAGR